MRPLSCALPTAVLALACGTAEAPGDPLEGLELPAPGDPGKSDAAYAELSCGEALEGAFGDKQPFRLAWLDGRAGQTVRIRVEAEAADPLVALFAPGEREPLAVALDCGDAPRAACLEARLPVTGPHLVAVGTWPRKPVGGFFLVVECEAKADAGHATCRDDAFLIEAPIGVDAPPADFGERLAEALAGRDPAAATDWEALLLDALCGGDAACEAALAGAALAEVEPLLPARPGSDGHRRFFRVRLAAPAGNGTCVVVDALRAEADRLLPGGGLHIGRECPVHVLGAETHPSAAMLDWHLDRLGVPPHGPDPAPPAPDAPGVDVVIVDTGIEPDVARRLGAREAVVPGEGARDIARHPHGTAMALLVRQVAPDARLHAVRFMNADGVGDIGDLARAIDAAVFELPGDAPRIVNLSVGWAPELSLRRDLTGPGCATHEDPAGEVVRFVLVQARRRDEAGAPTIVVAAAGNRGGRAGPTADVHARLYAVSSVQPLRRQCARADRAPRWFYPAQWGRSPTCLPGLRGVEPRVLALTVGAIDDEDRPTALSIDGAEPPLVAPGELVYAAPTRRFGAGPVCTADPPKTATRRPQAVSGTSASAALVSGALARAQAHRLALGEPPLSWPALTRLVWLSATSVGRASPVTDLETRRLAVDRLDAAVACPELARCATGRRGPDGLSRAALAGCARALRPCRLPPARPADAVPWDPAFKPEACAATTILPPIRTFADIADCPPGGCPFERLPDRYSVGYTTPQPNSPLCPDCALRRAADGTWRLTLQPTASLSNAYLLVHSGGHTGYAPLSARLDPGGTTVVDVNLGAAPAGVAAALVGEVELADGTFAADTTGLRVFGP